VLGWSRHLPLDLKPYLADSVSMVYDPNDESVNAAPSACLSPTETLQALLMRKGLLEEIIVHISNGGDLLNLAEMWGVRFGELATWLHADIERDRRYKEAQNDRIEWAVERILKELRKIGLVDIREIYDESGCIKDPRLWSDELAHTVQSLEVFEEFEGRGADRKQIGYTKKVKFWDKTKSLELLGKNLKIFADVTRHELSAKLEDLIASTPRVEDE
jgi:hypothetical protein